MAKKVIRHPDKQVSTGAYSAAVEAGGWVYVSGHASLDLKTGQVLHGTTAEETERTLLSIGKLLKAAGCGFEDVVKSNCHLANIEDFAEFNQAYAQFFPTDPPARTTVQSTLFSGLKVEIDVIARVPGAKS